MHHGLQPLFAPAAHAHYPIQPSSDGKNHLVSPFSYSTRSNLPQTLTIYGSREAAIYSFEEDSEFPVYSWRIKSLQRQSLVIEITKLIIENYYYEKAG
jgi:hypothetical protein